VANIAASTCPPDGLLGVDFRSAAMAAAWAAAAEVPQNGLKPGVAVATQSAAVRSGFRSSMPPPEAKVIRPGVTAVPLGW
jgi:hypothetical protein